MKHFYYTVVEFWSNGGSLGSTQCEIWLDHPISSMNDIEAICDYQLKQAHNSGIFGTSAEKVRLTFYHFLRTEEQHKDTSKFKMGVD